MSSAVTAASKSEAATRRAGLPEWAWVVVAGWFVFVLHALCRVRGFGEQDAARLARDSVIWHLVGTVTLDDFEYRLRSSPLYLHGMKLALDHGLAIRQLPALMSWLSVVASSVCLGALYYLFKELADRASALTACALCALMPGFWLCSIYGIPTLPGLACWLLAALAFTRACALERWQDRRLFGWLALSVLGAWLALALKADLILCSGLFLALLWPRRERRLELALAAAGVLGTACLAQLAYARAVTAPSSTLSGLSRAQSVGEFSAQWSAQFPFGLENLLNPGNSATVTHASGTFVFALLLLALVSGAFASAERRALSLAAALSALPTLLFWGLKAGNSARHNVPALPVLALCATGLAVSLAGSARRARLLLLCVVLLGWLDTSGNGSIAPSANLLHATSEVTEQSNDAHARVRAFLHQPGAKKAIIDRYMSAYGEFEAFAFGERPSLNVADWEVTIARTLHIRLLRVNDANEARERAFALRKDGWQVFSLRYEL